LKDNLFALNPPLKGGRELWEIDSSQFNNIRLVREVIMGIFKHE